SGRQVIENDRRHAGEAQCFYGVAADITGAAGNENHLRCFLKYSMVSFRPSSITIFGFHRRISTALEISGRLTFGSSTGRSCASILLELPVSARTLSARSRTVRSSGLPMLNGIPTASELGAN